MPPRPKRYVVVNETTHFIIGGPYLWNGEGEWRPEEAGTLMLESEADDQGYTWEPPPAPEE